MPAVFCRGEKTLGSFFIAAILAMSYPRMVVFGGAVAALAVMTALSAGFGYLLPSILPKTYTHYASAVRALVVLNWRSAFMCTIQQ